MLNLLPQREKEMLLREYRSRRTIVVLWMFFITTTVVSILLIPSALLSSQREASAQERFDLLMKSVEKGSTNELERTLLEGGNMLKLFSHEAPKVLLHESLMRIVLAKTGRISLANFSFVRDGAGKLMVDIGGVAKDREALLAFVKALEHTGLFEKVSVPISNFAKNSDIDFTIQTVGVF